VELRAEERLARLRVGHVSRETLEPLELALAPLARRLGDRLVDVVGEELERRALVPLLAHEEERRARGEERHRRGDAERVLGQPVAERAVADLVVVLRADDEAPRVVAGAAEVVGERATEPKPL
jgi:hypothetical protein